MAIDLRISGGDVATPAGVRRADVLVDGEKIVGIVSPSVEISEVGRTIDATGKLVIPGMVDPHVHTREDEFSIVTAGAIGFRSGSDEVVLEAGGYISKPRGELHTMWNAGPGEARMIEVITPACFEGFFRELADLVEAAAVDKQALEGLAASYGLFMDPTWVPELMERYALRSPFA